MKNSNSLAYEVERLKKHVPLMHYDGTKPFLEWQKQAKEKLTDLLGLPLEFCDPELTIEYTQEYETHTEYRFTVQTEPGYHVPCHLCVPKGVGDSIPLTICLSGHGGGMHVALGKAKKEADENALKEWPHRAMAPRSIKEGRCALVIEARNFGESSVEGYGTSCTEAGKTAIIMGRTVIGERVWDAMRILDAVLNEFPMVDPSDIACTGNSGGGTATYYLACLEERITTAMPSCAVCEFEYSIAAMPHCLCNHIPGIRKYFEMGDLGGLIAPRKLIIAAGEKDHGFLIEGTRKSFETVKMLYEAAGVADRCALEVVDGGHFNYADHLWNRFYEMKRNETM